MDILDRVQFTIILLKLC